VPRRARPRHLSAPSPPAPGWSADGHRIKSELDYGRGPEKTWVYGALRPADGHETTMAAASRNSANYQDFLQKVEQANPDGEIVAVTDNLSSHNSLTTRTWLEDHPRISHAFIPVGAPWLNLRRRMVADLPQDRPGRPVLRRPRRDRNRHRPGHRLAQHPRHTLDLGTPRPTDPETAPPLCLPPLRNAALGQRTT